MDEATAEFRIDRDPLARFVEGLLVPKVGASIEAAELFKVYETWCERDARAPLSNTAFGRKIVGRRVENAAGQSVSLAKAKSGTVRYLDVEFASFELAELRDWKQKAAGRRGGDPGAASPDDYGAARDGDAP